MTADHVVLGAQHVDIILDNNLKRRYPATIMSSERVKDVALLRIGVGHRRPLTLADLKTTKVGQSVAVIGYPVVSRDFFLLGGDKAQPTMHAGNISAIRMNGALIQFDAATDHGDSGGPLLDVSSGRVLGIVRGSAWLDDLGEPLPGSALATSSATVQAFLRHSGSTGDAALQRYEEADSIEPGSWDSKFGHAIDKLLMVLLWIMLAGSIVIAILVAQLYASWRIVAKAGYSGWWRFFALLPILNLIVLYIVALSKWPLERKVERLRESAHQVGLSKHETLNPAELQYTSSRTTHRGLQPEAHLLD